jgi:hypothetical protein
VNVDILDEKVSSKEHLLFAESRLGLLFKEYNDGSKRFF